MTTRDIVIPFRYCFSIHPCMMQQPDFICAMDALYPKRSRYELW